VPLSAGAQLGAYQIRGLVGAGGMGEVYRAFDPRLNRHVAIKVVPDDISGDPRRRERLRREAHAIASLTHPYIVTVHSAEDIDGHLVLVMELIEGKTLAELLPAGGLPLSRLVKLAVQIADALGAAHDRGVIHRDLKPRNVMVTTDGRVKVLDFGLAKLRDPNADSGDEAGFETASLHALTAEGRIVGTAAYMSPEQAEGRRLDHRSDLFSLGIVLYELATGERPFVGESVVSVLSSILRDAPKPLTELNPRLPREFTRIVRRCLAKDPDERYQSAKDLRLDLEDLRQDLGSSDQLPAVPGARPPSRLARALPLATVGAAALALGAVLAAALLPRGGTSAGIRLVTADRLTVEPGPEGSPFISPDGQWVVYTRAINQGPTNIYLQAVGGERALNLTADSGAGNGQPAFSPDGNRIAFRSSRGGGGLFVMGRTGELVRQVTDEGFWPSWSPDATRLAYSTEQTIDVPYTYAGGSSIWTVDLASGRKTRLTDLDGTQPSWSPHDRRIAFWGVDPATQHRDIWTVPVGGGPAVRVTDDAAIDATPAWSADGRFLYFSSSRSGTTNLWRVAIDETTGATHGPVEAVIVPTQNAVHPTISRDGRRLAYTASTWSSDVYAFPFDLESGAITGPPRWVLGGPHWWVNVRFAPDGRRVSALRASQQRDLIIASAEGGNIQRLTDERAGVRCPVWAPDGRSIVILPTRRGDKDIIVVEPDSGRTRRITDLPSTGLVGCPAFSPDGQLLSLTQGPSDPAALIFNPGKPLREQQVDRLPTHPRGAFVPRAWSPDGERIAGTIVNTIAVFHRPSRQFTIVAEGTRVLSATEMDWLPDGRRLVVVADPRTMLLVDSVTQEVRPLYSSAPDIVRSLSLSVVRRELVVSRGPDEADVWIATIQSQ
jgi:eukaryotic-like serine/threonine-protein kinase